MATNTNDPKYHARKMRWYWKNRDKVRQSTKEHYKLNADTERKRSRDYYKSNKLRAAYNAQKYSAKKRGIEWNFFYEEWSNLWYASGKLAERGRRADEYQMCRKGDKGAYEITNVFIATCRENRAQQKVAGGKDHWNYKGKDAPKPIEWYTENNTTT